MTAYTVRPEVRDGVTYQGVIRTADNYVLFLAVDAETAEGCAADLNDFAAEASAD